MCASAMGHLSTVLLLLTSGASKKALNAYGKTAFALASTLEVKAALK